MDLLIKEIFLALLVLLSSACGGSDSPATQENYSSYPASQPMLRSPTAPSHNKSERVHVGIGFKVDESLQAYKHDDEEINPRLNLVASTIVIQGISYAIVNVMGCTDPRYNLEKELHFNGSPPASQQSFTVALQASQGSCYLSLDILRLTFDNNGTAATESYVRDKSAASQASAGSRDATVIFINQTTNHIGPEKISASAVASSWASNAPGNASSLLTYTLQALGTRNVGTRSLATIAVNPVVPTNNNAINIGAAVNMPINLLTVGPVFRPSGVNSAGVYAFKLWCNEDLTGSACGDVLGDDASTVFCAIPVDAFNPSIIATQCPAGVGASTATQAQRIPIAAFTANGISDNATPPNARGVLGATPDTLDDFWFNTIPSNGSFTLVIRTDTAGGSGFRYWTITNLPVTAPALYAIAISNTAPTLRRLGSDQFTAIATYTNNTTATITTSVNWNSSNPVAATIGLNSGVLNGTATIGTTDISATLNAVTSNVVSINLVDFAYIANFNNNTISYCPVKSDGSLEPCTAVTNTGAGNNTFSGPKGLMVNPEASRLYVANATNSTVSYCALNATGGLVSCTAIPSSVGLSGPSALAFHPGGNNAYVANTSGTNVSLCPVAANGSFNNCTSQSNTAAAYTGITLNAAGTYAYLVNGVTTVYKCSINQFNFRLSGCTANTNAAFANGAYGALLNAATSFVYVTPFSAAPTQIALCGINANNGSLTSCSSQAITPSLAYSGPTYMSFIPNFSDKIYISASNLTGSEVIIFATVNSSDGTLSGFQFLTDPTFDGIQGISIE
jgi:6-phosphogluconolactonase (cycloisomerase 2 family)